VSVELGPEWRTFGSRLGRTPVVMEREIRRTLQASLLLIEGDAKTNVARDVGRLGSSINSRVQGTFPRITGSVGPSVRYGYVVEFGRRPGGRMPPVDALVGWVRRHWSPGSSPTRAGPARSRAWQQAGAERLRSRAFALARSIQRRGTRPQPFMEPAYRRNRLRISAMFARIGVRTTAYLAGRPIP
jgi:hypothetical protein